MKRKLLFALLYSVFGLVTYFLFLYLTFPSDIARERMLYEAHKAGYRLQLVDFKPAWPAGVTLKGVDFYGVVDEGPKRRRPPRPKGAAGAPGAEGEEAAPAEGAEAAPAADTAANESPLLTLDRITISSLLPMVMPGAGGSPVKFDAELYGGSAEGSYGQEDGFTKVALALNSLDFAKYPMVGESYDLKLGGRMSLSSNLSLSKEKVRDSTGGLNLKLENLAVHKGSKLKGFDIPVELVFKPTEGSIEVKNGRAELTEMVMDSGPVQLKISGTVTLNQVMARSRFNLKVAMKFGEELKLVSAFLPENAKSDDGYYHYIISGPFNNLRTRPDRLGARRRARATSPAGSDAPLPEPASAGIPAVDRPPLPGLPGALPGMNGGEGGPGGAMRPPILDDAERERLREERRQRAEERRRRREELRQQRLNATGGEEMPGAQPPGPRGPMGLDQENDPAQRRFRGNDDNEPVPIDPDPMEQPQEIEPPQPWEDQ